MNCRPPGQDEAVVQTQAMMAGMRSAFLLAFALVLIALIAAFFLKHTGAPKKQSAAKQVSPG